MPERRRESVALTAAQAISSPNNEEAQQAAWAAVSKRVLLLKEFFLFSQELDTAVPLLLEALCAHDPLRSLETKQALVKQLAELLQFVLAFDEQKLKNPSIQNDFSYYRRTLSRLKMNEIVSRHAPLAPP